MNKNQDKTLLITGATGFLGSHLTKYFLRLGYQIAILKRSFSKTDRLNDVLKQLICFNIDECSLSKLFLNLGKVDAVIHTATDYGKKSNSASFVANSNTFFPLLLIEEAVNHDVKIFINTDTYFNKWEIPYQGLANYSLSKKHFEDWGKHLANSSGIHFVNIRLEHLYGINDNPSKFVTYVIQSCLLNKTYLNLTEGLQKRDFIYIDDAVSAFEKVLNNTINEQTQYREYQLGWGYSITIKELVKIIKYLSCSSTILNFGAMPYQDFEIMDSKANNLSLLALGWDPKTSLKQGLRKTICYEAKTLRSGVNIIDFLRLQ